MDTICGCTIIEQYRGSDLAEIYRVSCADHADAVLKISSHPVPFSNDLIAREFYILSKLKHPNIIRSLGYGVHDDGRAFLLLEYFPGLPVNECFKGYSRFLMSVMAELLAGMIYIHNAGYVHGDLKPSHVRHESCSGRTKLIDFGFAGVSALGEARGTLGYSAPEILKGRGPDQRSDVYSLGMILAEVIGGRAAAQLYERQKALIVKRPDRQDAAGVLLQDIDAPGDIRKTLSAMLAVEPALRPTAFELHETFLRHAGRIRTSGVPVQPSVPPMTFIDTTRKFDYLSRITNIIGRAHVIIGGPGMGKTFLLNELMFLYRNAGADVVALEGRRQRSFFSSLRDYSGGKEKTDHETSEYAYYEMVVEDLRQRQRKYKKPLVIAVDDLQMSAIDDKNFLRYLGLSITNDEIGLIAAGTEADALRSAGFAEIQMAEMTVDDIKVLVRNLFAGNIRDDAFSAWLFQMTGGNPLYIQSLITRLVRIGAINFKNGVWVLGEKKYASVPGPGNIRELISESIRTLDDRSRQLLELVCCVDYPLEPALASEAGGTRYVAEYARLKEAGLIVGVPFSGRPAFAPHNLMIKEIVAEVAGKDRITGLQRGIYHLLMKLCKDDPDYHGFIAQAAGAARAWREGYDFACRAAEREEGSLNLHGSLRYYELALDYARKAEIKDRSRLLMKKGELHLYLGLSADALDDYLESLKSAVDPVEKAKIHHMVGYVYQVMGHFSKSTMYLRKALRATERRDHQFARILGGIGYNHIQKKDYSQARKVIRELSRLASETESSDIEYRVYYLNGVLCGSVGDLEKSIESLKNALPISELLGKSSEIALHHALLASLYHKQGKYQAAGESYQKAILLYERIKDIPSLTNALINSALVLKNQCRFTEANTLLEEARGYARKINNHQILAKILVNMANLHEIKGEIGRALELNHGSLETYPNNPIALYNLSIINNRTGNYDKALSYRKLLSSSDSPSLHRAAKIELLGRSDKADGMSEYVEQVMAESGESERDSAIRTELYLKAAAACFNKKLFKECLGYASRAKQRMLQSGREYAILDALAGLAACRLDSSRAFEAGASLAYLRDKGCLYDWAVLKRMEIEAFVQGSGNPADPADLAAAEEVLSKAGDVFEANLLKEARAMMDERQKAETGTMVKGDKYLSIFNTISDLLNAHLGESDFTDKLLDTVLAATGAERGALFFVEDNDVQLVAGRNVDNQTIKDAKKLSRSVINEAHSTMEPIESNDVLRDERFQKSKSVLINRIKSLLCVPLRIDCRVVGVIYLDNTYKTHVFRNEDRNFIGAVANLLATTIDKSLAFQRLRKENASLKEGVVSEIAEEYLVGNSPAIRKIRETIERIARINSTVLLVGETGCGKGIVARLIHQRSNRSNGRFVSINCGALPETLFEAELFGYKKGAFTGASNNRKGLLLEADKGTLFLDEISNAPVMVQGKLLEVLEDKQIRRLGENIVHKADVRLICATNQDLERLVKEGRFRIDLYYRISVLTIFIPPLRKRSEDIPILAEHFLKKHARELNPAIVGFDQKSIRMMISYPWPGNVRELQNSIERAVIYARSNHIEPNDLQLKSVGIEPIRIRNEYQDRIVSVLHSTKCNITMAAKLLGITRTTLYSYIQKYGINLLELKNNQ